MLRGSSSLATRPSRNFKIRREMAGSSLLSSRWAAVSNSIAQAIAAHHFFDGNGLSAASTNPLQSPLGQVHCFQVGQAFNNRLAGIVSFRATGALGKAVEALFDVCRKADGVYVFSHDE